ncbi:hypothetical protein O3M35_005167 [Rhynocoris fuscipes]|uniref:Uncharacterized protein n=1 Tax=Rhynocoris fuscipes TaxID=488301 RepID=A0AAW1DH60_9HEMI
MLSIVMMIMFGIVVSVSSTPVTTNWNEQVDFLLMWFDYSVGISNNTETTIPDIVTDSVTIRDAKLANMNTLVRDSDVFMEEPKIDDLRLYGIFSLKKFKLIVDDFRYKEYVGPANFTASKDAVEISYYLKHHTKPGQCKTIWEKFQLSPFENVIMYSKNNEFNKKDITDEVNKIILPEINKLTNSESYKKILNEKLDFCFINLFK